ncbi:hypothetical protein [Zobellia sp. 1_MG-2023]|uniref:hypothetical protein n=1 Tax=Zobellia sp. 1_MG-2023 TaxID=3062626 RepID=UPI0026E1ADC2|nr:hypothetical protein [Zobellia sp. 1_MG-2023]MDO6817538.1 hypothetical protein [Zobellia sp. 1_MG-2023]
MKILKYIFGILLVIWGLLIAWTKLFSVGLHFPFLTVLTIVAIILGISKHRKHNLIFFISASLWILFSAETIGFVIFFDSGNYERMIIGIIPLVLGIGFIISSRPMEKWIKNLNTRLLIIPALIIIGICSYAYKPSTDEVNCWYYFENTESYNVRFAQAPDYTFEVRLSSEEVKEKVKKDGLQYASTAGHYCPETKVSVVTCFGNVISAKVMSFRNSEIDKKVVFNNPAKIPLDKVQGKIEILKPFMLRLWN